MEKHLESYKSLIGKKIQKRRIEKGFVSQGSLAKKLGTDQSQVSRWESGKNIPEGQLKNALCGLLEVSEDFFEMIEVSIQSSSLSSDRAQLILEIQSHLTALNEDQLRTVLALASEFSSSRSADSSSFG